MASRDAVSLEETVLDFVRKTEEAALEVGRKWAEAVGEFVPVEMPDMRDLQKQIFNLFEELLRMQGEFARMLAEMRKAVAGDATPAPTRAPRKGDHKAA